MTIEVGPIAHSTSNSALYQLTKKVLHDALTYIELHNEWVTRNMSLAPIRLGFSLGLGLGLMVGFWSTNL
jgi:hypothetical protein